MSKTRIPTKRLGIYHLQGVSAEGLVEEGRRAGYSNLEIGRQLNALSIKLRHESPELSRKAHSAAKIAFGRHNRGIR